MPQEENTPVCTLFDRLGHFHSGYGIGAMRVAVAMGMFVP